MNRVFACLLCLFLLSGNGMQAWGQQPFALRVVDEETGRGVPLVQLTTTPSQIYMTDSNGYVALDEPTFFNQKVYFEIFSHGYEYPKDFFGKSGIAVEVVPGGEQVVKLKRVNIAERLYRMTGAGIYRDSVKLKKSVPIQQPLLNGEVCGQDTVQAAVIDETVYWFFGDTNRLRMHLGQFNTSGATSKLPSAGGLDPDKGVDLEYVVGDDGFSRTMFPFEGGVLIWVHGTFAGPGPDGKQRVFTHYSRRKSLAEELSAGLAILNEQTQQFETVYEYKEGDIQPHGQSFRTTEDGVDYICFAMPYASVRVAARWEAISDPAAWESYTPLRAGAAWNEDRPELDRRQDGSLNFGWKKNTPFVKRQDLEQLVRRGLIKESENPLRTVDAASGREVKLHSGSIKWNPYRERWVTIAQEVGGESSLLGEIWYAEARRPEGPFSKAVKIVTHQGYSFYNVAHQEFFDQQGGQLIYFQGTYTNLFTKIAPTPWYEYNQIMYRLDLNDPRLTAAHSE